MSDFLNDRNDDVDNPDKLEENFLKNPEDDGEDIPEELEYQEEERQEDFLEEVEDDGEDFSGELEEKDTEEFLEELEDFQEESKGGFFKRQKYCEKNKKISRKGRVLIRIAIFGVEILVLVLVLAGLFVNSKVEKVDSGHKIEKKDLKVNELTEETHEVLEKYTTIALFGLDNRSTGDFAWGNSDVIMVASINENTKEVKLVSVYRDTCMDITEGLGYRKANAAYANGGVEQAVNMLNVNLDLNISDYVIVDFNAVVTAIDTLGGIELQVTDEEAHWMEMYIVEMNDVLGKNSSYIPGAGVYNMDGIQATAFARVRYTAGDDFKRTERQRLVIQKMVEKALSTDLATLNNLIDVVLPEVKTSFSSGELLLLAKDAFNYRLGENTGFPFEKEVANVSGKAGECVVAVDLSENVKQLHKFLYSTQEYQVTQSLQNISDEIESITGVRP